MYFLPNGVSRPAAYTLFPDEQIDAHHHLQTSSRDFSTTARIPGERGHSTAVALPVVSIGTEWAAMNSEALLGPVRYGRWLA